MNKLEPIGVNRAAEPGRTPDRYITHDEWMIEAKKRFGPDAMKWRFVCPACGWAATVQEWKDAGASEGEVAFSCIGRRTKIPTQCNYAGGGLIRLNPVHVLMDGGRHRDTFEFAPLSHVQPTRVSVFR